MSWGQKSPFPVYFARAPYHSAASAYRAACVMDRFRRNFCIDGNEQGRNDKSLSIPIHVGRASGLAAATFGPLRKWSKRHF